jgi:uncharacterized membrane protein
MKARYTTERSTQNARTAARPEEPAVKGNKGTRVEIVTTINRSPEDLFSFWRNFENLPQIMAHVESVNCTDDTHSHWQIRRSENKVVEWEAVVINERPNEMIAWRTIEGSDVEHAGSVWFTPGPSGLGTEVKLAVEYNISGFADTIARLFRRSPEQQMREDLRHFKQWMEAGEIPTTLGQSAGRREDKTEKYEEAK